MDARGSGDGRAGRVDGSSGECMAMGGDSTDIWRLPQYTMATLKTRIKHKISTGPSQLYRDPLID